MALGEATKEAIWLKKLLSEIGCRTRNDPIDILSDNMSAIALTKNSTYDAKTKHIEIRHHFVREKVKSDEIRIAHCGTNDMTADILTKALSKEKHIGFVAGMG